MPSKKVTDLSDIGTPASGDKILIVDVSDTTDSAAGTSKYLQVANIPGGGGSTFSDASFRIQDDGDATKQIAFQASGITTGTTRTITAPDRDVDLGKATIESIIIAIGDETTAITTGTAKVTFRMPYAFTLTAVRASLTGAGSTSGTTTFDINESGSTILSTKLTIDQGEKTSTTAATAAVISDASLADDAEITIDVDAVTGGADETGAKITLIGYQ